MDVADVAGVIRFWDYLAQQCMYSLNEHRPSKQTLGIAVNCTTDRFVSFGADSQVNVYDLSTHARLAHLSHSCVPRFDSIR